MPEGTGIDRFAREFPDRAFDVGIAEQHAVLFAAGLATQGYKPVCAIYSTFLQRAYDQIMHDVCLMDLPVVFALDRAGLVGADGPTHHGAFDLTYLRVFPNMVVCAPKDENELQHLLASCLAAGHPAALRYPRGNGWGVAMDPEPRPLPVGKGEVLRVGRDGVVVAVGDPVVPSLRAADRSSVVPGNREGSNGREGQSTLDLAQVLPEKSRKLELPSRGSGEAGTYSRSEGTQAAGEGDEGSGTQWSGGFQRLAA